MERNDGEAGAVVLATVSDTAKTLNVSERHIYKMIERGDMPAVKVGRAWRINLAEFMARGGTR